MNDETNTDPYKIWIAIKNVYASGSIISVFQVWNKWRKINFAQDMNKFISQIEESLGEFSSIGLKVPEQLISSDIIGRIAEKRPILMEALFSDLDAIAKPRSLITKLREIGCHETSTGGSITKGSGSSTTALAATADKSKNPKCKFGRHNPAATTHTKENCWTLKPKLKEQFKREKLERSNKRPQLAYHSLTSQNDNSPNNAPTCPSFAYH